MMFLYVKALHIIAVICWFAGLFYLPRLFVYHAENKNQKDLTACFKVMEYKLYYYIMWPSAIFTTLTGLIILCIYEPIYLKAGWMHSKLALVLVLWCFHLRCGYHLNNLRTSRYFRIFNEIPTILLIAIVFLVVKK